jgi:hypothetical protein
VRKADGGDADGAEAAMLGAERKLGTAALGRASTAAGRAPFGVTPLICGARATGSRREEVTGPRPSFRRAVGSATAPS